jgi:hypothetical protein
MVRFEPIVGATRGSLGDAELVALRGRSSRRRWTGLLVLAHPARAEADQPLHPRLPLLGADVEVEVDAYASNGASGSRMAAISRHRGWPSTVITSASLTRAAARRSRITVEDTAL